MDENIKNELAKIADKTSETLKAFEAKVSETGTSTAALKADLQAVTKDYSEVSKEIEALQASVLEVQQKGADSFLTGRASTESLGNQFVNSTAFSKFTSGESSRASLDVQNNTILTGGDNSLTDHVKTAFVGGAVNTVSLLDALPRIPVNSNLVYFSKETGFTNNAAVQVEGAAKAESSIVIAESSEEIKTIAHCLRVSKQSLSDASYLQAYLDSRMGYGVRRKAEDQIVAGTAATELSGLAKTGNHTVVDVTADATISDAALSLKTSVEVAGYVPTRFVMNPADFAKVENQKSTDGIYTYGSPASATSPILWGVPVIKSVSVPEGAMYCFDSSALFIADREAVSVQMFEQDGDNATQNLVTVRAEARLANVVTASGGIAYGDLTTLGTA